MIAYCKHCREDIDYSADPYHYHEPLNTRCQICGAFSYFRLCAACSQSAQDEQREEIEMCGTRVRRGRDA